VAGPYAIIGVQTVVTGGGWFSALALCLVNAVFFTVLLATFGLLFGLNDEAVATVLAESSS
jgi:hypothetical protein